MRCLDDHYCNDRDLAPVKSCEVFDLLGWPYEVSLIASSKDC